MGQKLQNAAAIGDLATVRRIIEGGFDVNHDLGGNSTALHMAASCGKLEVIRYLLSKGADPSIRDSLNRTPAALAGSMSHPEAVQVLRKAEANGLVAVGQRPVTANEQLKSTAANSTPQTAAEVTKHNGVDLFYAGRYAEAVDAFSREALSAPGSPAVYYWRGIAMVGLGQDPSDTWRKAPITNDTLALTLYLEGLENWKSGNTNIAEIYFRDTLKYPGTLGQKLASQAMTSLAAQGRPPALSSWPGLSQLPGARGANVGAAPAVEESNTSTQVNSNSSGGPIPTGLYVGYSKFVAVGTDQTGNKPRLKILPGGRYQFLSHTIQDGTFAYNSSTGVITFTSGPYAEDGVKGAFGKRGDGKPMLTITYGFDGGKSTEDMYVLVSE